MLTSFFSKSKPIHFVFMAIYMAVFYSVSNFIFLETENNWIFITRKVAGLGAFLLTMLILNFIAQRNELTKNNAYKIVLFATFSALFIEGLQNTDIIFANLFVVLALRRVISLKSQQFSKEKIFDAVFWISVASLFSFWAILFAAIVYLAIIIHVPSNYKNWLVPPLAFIAVCIITTCAHLLVNDQLYTFSDWFQSSNLDFSYYRNLEILIPLSFLLALSLWTLWYFLGYLQRASAGVRPSLVIILTYLGMAVAVGVLSTNKDTGEIMYYFVPLSIVVANYFDISKDKWFKEALLIILLVLPFLLPLFRI